VRSAAALSTVYDRVIAEAGVAVETGIAYGPAARHVLDVYRPTSGGERGPIAIFIYGGGWRGGDRANYGFVGSALASRGITTVIPDYRVFPEVGFPTFVDDAALAYAWVSANLAGKAGARRPIVLIGHSAGAYIAAMLALDEHKLAGTQDRPAALIGLSGPYAFDPTTWPSTVEIFTAAARADDARPVAFVRKGAPPTLLMHGAKDETVRLYNTRELAAALTAVGTPVRTVEFDGIGHTDLVLAIARPLRWRAPVLQEIVAFIAALR
jgi:acetyl esterase/lipase